MNIVFICHGNICRSPIAEILFANLVKEHGLQDKYHVISRATSLEEIGNDIYPPMKRVLNSHGVRYERHYASRLSLEEFNKADYIFYMDSNNLRYLERLFGSSSKFHLITEYNGGHEIEDPWYTDRFEYVYQQIKDSVLTIFNHLENK